MANKIKRVVGKHRKGCHAVRAVKEGMWDTPWACSCGIEWHNKNGAGEGMHTWTRFICNDLKCSAYLLVSDDAIFSLIGETVKR